MAAAVTSQGFVELPINISDGQTAGALPATHKDPFDRMLIAIAADMVIVSNESLFNAYAVARLW
jgi:PIN domain nuclease of toxin-antitoxin system